MLIPIHICIWILSKYHEDMEQWIVTISQRTIGYISPHSLIQTSSFDYMTVTEEKVISDTSIKVSVYFSQRQLSLLLVSEGGSLPSGFFFFFISLSFVRLFYVFKSNSTAALMFPRTGIFNRDSSKFRHVRKEGLFCVCFFFIPHYCAVELYRNTKSC